MAQTAGGTYYAASSELVSSWPATSLNLANQLESRFAAKSDYAITQNAQTGTGASAYTFVLADASRLTLANAASAATYTIPPQASVAWVNNSIIQVTSIGAGVITFAGGAGVTVTNTAATLSQYQTAALIRTGSNAWTVIPFSGGTSTLTVADVSATTGSPTISTYTLSGVNYTVYKFTGSGSITFSKSGFCDVLAVGGGGCGFVGGGGAGGMYDTTQAGMPQFYAPSGTHTVTVGGGGASYVNGSASIFAKVVIAPGGGAAEGVIGSLRGDSGSSGGGGRNAAGGAGITGLGNAGGLSSNDTGGGGGGGAGGAGATGSAGTGGAGGSGLSTNILTGTSTTLAGGGGGGGSGTGGAAGSGGGGAGNNASGNSGTVNTGGGSGGGYGATGKNGGSGIVAIRVRT